MSFLITGASGHLGRLVVEQLLATGEPAHQIVATGRDLTALADLATTGVRIRSADLPNRSSSDRPSPGLIGCCWSRRRRWVNGSTTTATRSTRPVTPGSRCWSTPACCTPTGPGCGWPRSTDAPRNICAAAGCLSSFCAMGGIWRTTPTSSPSSPSTGFCWAALRTDRSARPAARGLRRRGRTAAFDEPRNRYQASLVASSPQTAEPGRGHHLGQALTSPDDFVCRQLTLPVR